MFKKVIRKNSKEVTKHDYYDFLSKKVGINEIDTLPTSGVELKKKLEKIFENSDDFRIRSISHQNQEVVFYYFEGIVDIDRLDSSVIQPLVRHMEGNEKERVRNIGEVVLGVNYHVPVNWAELVQLCLQGQVISHISGEVPMVLSLQKYEKRTLSEPTTEKQVFGPKAGFIEDSRTNVVLMRKVIQDPRLKVKEYQVGNMSHTAVSVLYLDEYVDKELLEQVQQKIQRFSKDHIFNSNTLAKSLIEYPMSMFPQVQKSERPDQAAYALSQGKVIIIVDNSTFCLILPTTLFSFYEKSDDNDEGSLWNLSFLRLLRISSLIVATTFPALYVALVAFHPEMIPTTLALTMAESRNNIPFPAAVEAFIMMFALDVLVESSIRLPSFIGQTIGIVGGLVIGQAAVEAGIISSTMIIVIAFTAIAAFTVPSWEMAGSWRIVRYILLLFASLLGLYGLTIGICLLLIHLCALTSFNKPYLSPMSPFNPKEFIDVFFRVRSKNKEVGDK